VIKIVFFIFSMTAFATVQITHMELKKNKNGLQEFIIDYEGRIVSPPRITSVKGNGLLEWVDADPTKEVISKHSSILQYNDHIMQINLPKIGLSAALLSKAMLRLEQGRAKLTFQEELKNPAPIAAPVKGKVVKESSDYVNYLLSSVDEKSDPLKKNQENTKVDTKKLELSKPTNISYTTYLVKMIFVLAGVIGFFFLVVKLMKKVMVGRGSLNLLRSSKLIEVMTTTYIAPKRQLMLVKVHDQVLLLANSESGISLLSEVKNLAGLLKEAELKIEGSNFDVSAEQATAIPNDQIKLKDLEKLTESKPYPETSKVRQLLEKKVRSLKSWQ
jgi:flagellar biogenesis protein FliO